MQSYPHPLLLLDHLVVQQLLLLDGVPQLDQHVVGFLWFKNGLELVARLLQRTETIVQVIPLIQQNL